MKLFTLKSYCVKKLSDEDRNSEFRDELGIKILKEAPLNYEIINTETWCTEARSSFLPAAMHIALDLQGKLDSVRKEELKVPNIVAVQ